MPPRWDRGTLDDLIAWKSKRVRRTPRLRTVRVLLYHVLYRLPASTGIWLHLVALETWLPFVAPRTKKPKDPRETKAFRPIVNWAILDLNQSTQSESLCATELRAKHLGFVSTFVSSLCI